MSERPPQEGSHLGPYLLGRRLPDSDLGHLFEARHLETDAPALVLVPHASTRAPRESWTVRSRSEVSPAYVAVEVEDSPGASTQALHELTLRYIELSGVLATVEDQEDTAAFLARAPRASRPFVRSRVLHSGLAALAGVALGVGLMWLWPGYSTPSTSAAGEEVTQSVSGEPTAWVDQKDSTRQTIGYPMPSEPLKGQHKPPCLEGTAVEINGGCWVTLEQRAPCPRSTAEYQGKCYMPVRNPPPEPRAVEP